MRGGLVDSRCFGIAVLMHVLFVGAMLVTFSSGLLSGKGEALSEAIEVDLVFMPEVIPEVLAQEPVVEEIAIVPPVLESDVPHPDKKREEKKVVKKTQKSAVRRSASSAGRAGVMSYNYRHKLAQHIEKHKYYPASARRRSLQGKIMVAFKIGLQGDLRTAKIIKTSGHHLLDQAALVTIRQASPFPSPPEKYSLSDLAFSLPVHYSLKR